MNADDHSIRERAYRIWEQEGRPEGRAEHHWFQAKEIVAIEDIRPQAFRSAEVVEAPPLELPPSVTDEPERLSDAEGGGIENEPISEIETIRRTLEVPKERRGETVPISNEEGALGGTAGWRPNR
ncbi:DUF2934 domain-containing protein [Ancylobacter sp. G4_0304]|uniref:DUF2934 domain-containing protein n=1 Tax=Ancylobacter sp. G4_0304 TaxID=3114289 RepID=UPI0039C69334